MKKKRNNKMIGVLVVGLLVFPILMYILVLGPIYSLVGDTTMTQAQQQATLDRAARISSILQITASIALIVVVAWLVKGLIVYFQSKKDK
jgi:hypothetical protein